MATLANRRRFYPCRKSGLDVSFRDWDAFSWPETKESHEMRVKTVGKPRNKITRSIINKNPWISIECFIGISVHVCGFFDNDYCIIMIKGHFWIYLMLFIAKAYLTLLFFWENSKSIFHKIKRTLHPFYSREISQHHGSFNAVQWMLVRIFVWTNNFVLFSPIISRQNI